MNLSKKNRYDIKQFLIISAVGIVASIVVMIGSHLREEWRHQQIIDDVPERSLAQNLSEEASTSFNEVEARCSKKWDEQCALDLSNAHINNFQALAENFKTTDRVLACVKENTSKIAQEHSHLSSEELTRLVWGICEERVGVQINQS